MDATEVLAGFKAAAVAFSVPINELIIVFLWVSELT